ncbi:hypothetical protein DWB61_11610 [Ancylomarina euxinus]|uniref:Uncharacterized protein n=2 Tax=Ancylomarina euxinus TaxID=2283627 RepID=A0A425XZE9_9BACT|nr:hypothetical protein [Ancylomarina euxinus]MCZ4695520.1 hypothetical protein [Ancylomarina euxinus]RRG20655.1 hypothetical protein DWB61_11610 [Ancylomarina euxinus]
MNPFAKIEGRFTIESISINDKEYTENMESSAFEIDLAHMGFKLGEDLHFCIRYKDSITPSIINMEAIQAVSSFEMKKASIDKDQFLNWKCSNETGSLPFSIQQYRWNKWVTVGQLRGVGTDGVNHYRIKVPIHSGDNMFRIHQVDYTEKDNYSDTIQYKSRIKPVTLVNKKVTSKLIFSAPTQFEIFDLFGNLIYNGFGNEVRFDDLIPGKYYVNYDNTIGEFIKE